jgi:cardiolipin synthase
VTKQADRTRVVTVPNLISMARLVAVPVFAWLAWERHDLAALLVLALAGASDWLDGVIARKYDQGSRLGELLDPAADRLYILVTLLVLAGRGDVPWWRVGVIVARELVLVVVLLVLRSAGHGPLPVHFAGKAGTFALLYAFPLLLLATWDGAVGLVAGVVGWAFACWGIGLYWLACLLYVRQAIGLLRAGPGTVLAGPEEP